MKLTDEELAEAYHMMPSNTGHWNDFTKRLRAVQDAVLAKAEVEAREREREAYTRGVAMERLRLPLMDTRIADRKRDELYPSLLKPASVTLSTGTWTLQDGGIWQLTGGHARYDHCIYAPCKTVEDHQKVLAYLLAREGR